MPKRAVRRHAKKRYLRKRGRLSKAARKEVKDLIVKSTDTGFRYLTQTPSGETFVLNAWSIAPIWDVSNIAVGDIEANRTGCAIDIMEINVDGYLVSTASDYVTIALLRDLESTGSMPDPGLLFASNSSTFAVFSGGAAATDQNT